MLNAMMTNRLLRHYLPALAAGLLLTFSLAAAQPAHAQPAAQSKIAFDRGGLIWTMNADGTNQTVVNPDVQGINPSLSPDGTRIAFNCGIEPFDICVMNADGTGVVALTDTRDNSNPAWSPDGTRIAFTSYREMEPHIYIVSAQGGPAQRLAINDPSIISEDYPAWSADGTRIAFAGVTETASDVYTVNADGSGGLVRVTNSAVLKFNPAFSPDGTRIAFDTTNDLVVVGSSGGPEQVIASGPDEQNEAPAWSPDGSRIAFRRRVIIRDGSGNEIGREDGIYTIEPDGSGLASLNSPGAFNPDWKAARSTPPPPPSPAERINNLITLVRSYGLPFGTTNSLTVKLRAALQSLESGDTAGACARLSDFTNQVNAQAGKKLTQAQAVQLNAEAASIREALGCQ